MTKIKIWQRTDRPLVRKYSRQRQNLQTSTQTEKSNYEPSQARCQDIHRLSVHSKCALDVQDESIPAQILHDL
jgi:hypothetical protein